MVDENLKKLLDSIIIPEINPDTKFWMLRTYKGHFYDEFIQNNFIALGWNRITKERISNISEEDEKLLLEEIKKDYGIKQPGRSLNKCQRFINEIKSNDIIMIPNLNSDEISFVLAGEYYEDTEFNDKDEIETIKLIEEGWDKTLSIRCPYRKRRKIKLLKTIEGSKINPNLYRALVSYHSLSDITDYSDYILSSIFNIYYWNNRINYVFNIEKKREINPVDISKFIMSFAEISQEILKQETDINKLDGKMNINSPGDIILTLKNCANNIFEFLVANKMLFIVIWLSLVGGSIKLPIGFEFSTGSLLDFILKYREQNNHFKNDELNREFIRRNMDILSEKAEQLQINTENINNVIDIKKYLSRRDDQDI